MGGRAQRVLLTVGHGTLDRAALASLLHEAGVEALVDVRRHPGSRRHPHVARAALEAWVPEEGISYTWEEDLGGRRLLPPDSPDSALRDPSFRGYAAHMRTRAFDAALGRVLASAAERVTAIMCSESLWWRCHRRLVADSTVLLHGVDVRHQLHDGRRSTHEPTDGVRRRGDVLVYDATGQLPLA